MRCLAVVAALALAAVPATADPKAKSVGDAKAEVTEPAKPATCKKRVVGRGLERKVVCEFEQPIVVGAEPSRPKVIIAPVDGRKVVGRPKMTDPFAGLSRRRSTSL
ncbi:MAG: hypothetical protein M4D80_15400 [Myxococcota bacterium]|nr:hypothetical protein [Deltaproteobacteria bacterium]MDQ3336552.1 hypothetical protein [Myxococcota bacterium]